WEAGRVYADTYEIPLVRNVGSRYPFALVVNWYNADPDNRVEALNDGDHPISVILDIGAVIQPNFHVSLSNLQIPQDNNDIARTFGSVIVMEGFGYTVFDDELTFNVDVVWESQNNIEKDYIA